MAVRELFTKGSKGPDGHSWKCSTPTAGERGRIRRIYKAEDYRTPFEKLSSLDKWMQYLKPRLTCPFLTTLATRMSDNEAAKAMQKAKNGILKRVRLPW